MEQSKVKCPCGSSKPCKIHSRVRMVALLKSDDSNPVWYNYISKNRWPIDRIAGDMAKRMMEYYKGQFNWIIAYDNQDKSGDNEIKRFSP